MHIHKFLRRTSFQRFQPAPLQDFARQAAPREGTGKPPHVSTHRRAGHSDEPWTLPSRAKALQGSRSHLHGAKCVSKHGAAAIPLSERVSSGRPLSGTGSSRGGGGQRGRRAFHAFVLGNPLRPVDNRTISEYNPNRHRI